MESTVLHATDENMQAVNDFIHSQLPSCCSPKAMNELDLAVEEIYINIAHYSYAPECGKVEIQCDIAGTPPVLTLVFKDCGKPFDPLAKKDPDLTLSAEERPIGGLGIFLTKKFMDSVEYEYSDNHNVLTIKKSLL